MTSDELIAEGRKLQRASIFLRPEPRGRVAAVWHESELNQDHSLITVDTRNIPGFVELDTPFVTVKTDMTKLRGGEIDFATSLPENAGIKLYCYPADVLPPLEVVFALGSESVGAWLNQQGWNRRERYNSNFADREVTAPYLDIWKKEFPLYFDSDIYAVLGGWHWPGQDGDWYDLLDAKLMILTLRDAEPWIEVWRLKSGEFKVIQRTT